MRAMGAPPEVIEEAQRRAQPAEEICDVWEENWNSVLFFFACATQWNVGGMGGYLGLNYPGVEALMRMQGMKNRKALFGDLQVMEFAALEVLNKKVD
jgi:hypothetical protein